MENFPLLQSSTSCNPVARDVRTPHNLDLINGVRVVRDTFGPPKFEDEMIIYDPAWTYGEDKLNDPSRQDKVEEPRFVPNYVIFAQKCLKFDAYFYKRIDNFLNQKSSIRNVLIYYFLEDDTMSVSEPVVVNAGYKQGKLVRRAKIPKDEFEFYHWKDLNVGLTINIYGVNYHLLDCDTFTRNFLMSQGVDVNRKQEPPMDPDFPPPVKAAKPKPKMCREIQPFMYDQDTVLTFIAAWNWDKYAILYYPVDNTISVRRIPRAKDDDDPMNKLLLRRTKVIKERDGDMRYLEGIGSNQPSFDELKFAPIRGAEYYGLEDFKIGEIITILGRQFEIIDCTESTRRFFSNKLGVYQPKGVFLSDADETPPKKEFHRRTIDEPFTQRAYGGITKRDAAIRKLLNRDVKFRYLLKMIAIHPEDEGRQFILEYSLSDSTLTIREIQTENCGRTGKGFLAPAVVAKPSETPIDDEEFGPKYYSEQDFYIGAEIEIFSHRFRVIGADLAVWNYIKKHPDDFSEQLKENMRQHFADKEVPQKECDVEENKNPDDRSDFNSIYIGIC